MKPLRLRDTTLASFLWYLAPATILHTAALCDTLFQRLTLLSDTSLVQSAVRRSLLATFSTASKRYTIISFYPTSRCTRIIRLRQSGFLANGTRRQTLFATPYTADIRTSVRAVAGRGRSRRLCQLFDLHASTIPNSLRSHGIAPSPGL